MIVQKSNAATFSVTLFPISFFIYIFLWYSLTTYFIFYWISLYIFTFYVVALDFIFKICLVCLKSSSTFLCATMKMLTDFSDFTESCWHSQAQILLGKDPKPTIGTWTGFRQPLQTLFLKSAKTCRLFMLLLAAFENPFMTALQIFDKVCRNQKVLS